MTLTLYRLVMCCLGIVFCHASFAGVVSIQPGEFAANATIVTFETGSSALPAVPGMSFLSEGTGSISDAFLGDVSLPLFGLGGWSNIRYPPVNGFSNLGATFNPPVQAVGGWFCEGAPVAGSLLAGEMEVRLFDKDLQLVGDGHVDFIHAVTFPVWVGYKSDTLISRVEFLVGRVPDPGFLVGDNLTFGNVVPEPALAGPCAVVILGLASIRRRPTSHDRI